MYVVTQEKDGTGTNATTQHYQSIIAMPAYRNSSFEELRYQDYLQGRKTATSNSFGTSTGFGTFGATQPTNPGASTSGYNQPPGGLTFGAAKPPTTTGFGSFGQSTTGAFGQPAQPAATPAFGASTTNTGGGIFGGAANTGFGQAQAQQQPANAFGAFGQQNNQQKTFGFGEFLRVIWFCPL